MTQFEMAAGNGLLLVFVLIEAILIRTLLNENMPWKEVIVNLNSGHILMWVLRGLEVYVFYLVSENFSFDLLNTWPFYAQLIFAFIVWDFFFYWLHRLHHKIKLFWAVHVVHHEGEHFSLSLGIRNSWYSSITSIPFFIPLALVGVPVEIFLIVSSVHYFIQFYNHNHLVKKSGILEYILITPSHHRVHHGKNDIYIDKNFGGTFVFWDKMFGTFQPEMENEPVQFGVHEPIGSENPVIYNNVPFIKLFSKTFKYFNKVNSEIKIKNSVLVSGALLLFAQLLLFVYYEKFFSFDQKTIVFSIVFLGTIAMAGLSENRIWGIAFWLILMVIGPALFYFLYPHFHFEMHLVLLTGILHSLFLILSKK